jgi:hypothetical protein
MVITIANSDVLNTRREVDETTSFTASLPLREPSERFHAAGS